MKKFLMQVFIVFSLLLSIPANTSLFYENTGETIYEAIPTSDEEIQRDEFC